MRTRILAGFLPIFLMTGCAPDGSLDWAKVGDGVLLVGAVAIGAAAAVAASEPAYTPPVTTTCNTWRNSMTCTSY
jgi:hypothetical protein